MYKHLHTHIKTIHTDGDCWEVRLSCLSSANQAAQARDALRTSHHLQSSAASEQMAKNWYQRETHPKGPGTNTMEDSGFLY